MDEAGVEAASSVQVADALLVALGEAPLVVEASERGVVPSSLQPCRQIKGRKTLSEGSSSLAFVLRLLLAEKNLLLLPLMYPLQL